MEPYQPSTELMDVDATWSSSTLGRSTSKIMFQDRNGRSFSSVAAVNFVKTMD